MISGIISDSQWKYEHTHVPPGPCYLLINTYYKAKSVMMVEVE